MRQNDWFSHDNCPIFSEIFIIFIKWLHNLFSKNMSVKNTFDITKRMHEYLSAEKDAVFFREIKEATINFT